MVQIVTKFYSKDGKEFDSFEAAEAHEVEQGRKANDNYLKFIRHSYAYNSLLKKGYSLDSYGLWEILGEDDNADFGGYHYQPSLGLFEGTLDQVIRKAVSIPRFYSWGGGGDIKPISQPEKLGDK